MFSFWRQKEAQNFAERDINMEYGSYHVFIFKARQISNNASISSPSRVFDKASINRWKIRVILIGNKMSDYH